MPQAHREPWDPSPSRAPLRTRSAQGGARVPTAGPSLHTAPREPWSPSPPRLAGHSHGRGWLLGTEVQAWRLQVGACLLGGCVGEAHAWWSRVRKGQGKHRTSTKIIKMTLWAAPGVCFAITFCLPPPGSLSSPLGGLSLAPAGKGGLQRREGDQGGLFNTACFLHLTSLL